MKNLILIAIIVLILGAALLYVIRAKKRGVKCIGCAAAEKCSGNCSVCSSCNHKN